MNDRYDTHDCPGPGCKRQVPPHQLACGGHWRQVPRDVQRKVYAASPTGATMDPNAIGPAGEDRPHDSMQPFLAMEYCIALFGEWPERN